MSKTIGIAYKCRTFEHLINSEGMDMLVLGSLINSYDGVHTISDDECELWAIKDALRKVVDFYSSPAQYKQFLLERKLIEVEEVQ